MARYQSPVTSDNTSSILMPICDYFLPLAELLPSIKREECSSLSCSVSSTADSAPATKESTPSTSSLELTEIKFPTSSVNKRINMKRQHKDKEALYNITYYISKSEDMLQSGSKGRMMLKKGFNAKNDEKENAEVIEIKAEACTSSCSDNEKIKEKIFKHKVAKFRKSPSVLKNKNNISVNTDKKVLVINQGNWINWKRGGPCGHCGVTVSPQWRRGTSDKPVLCNACGTRYRRTGQFNAMSRSLKRKHRN